MSDTADPLDAIDQLREAARHHPDADVLARLVDARHAAFPELAAAPDGLPQSTIPSEAPVADEPTSGAGLEEITPEELNEARVAEALEHSGHLLVRGLFDPEWCEHLVSLIDEAFAGCEELRAVPGRQLTADWRPSVTDPANYRPFFPDPSYRMTYWAPARRMAKFERVPTVDSPLALHEVIEALDRTGLLAILTARLGSRPVAAANKWTLRRVTPRPGIAWHQDRAAFREPHQAMNVWVSLTACGVTAPGLSFIPLGGRRVIQPDDPEHKYDLKTWVHEVADRHPAVTPDFRPGDALLLDELLVHRTHCVSTMTEDRYNLECWCFGADAFPTQQGPIVL